MTESRKSLDVPDNARRQKPTRVKLRRLNASYAKALPPDGSERDWWIRLKSALATTSSDVVNATLQQLIATARLPDGAISETAVNAAISFIESAKPQNEVESALLTQMACVHMASLAVLGRVAGANGGSRNLAMMAAASAKLLNVYCNQVEALRRLRGGGSQVIRIERVDIQGGQAVIGNIATSKNS